MKAPTSRQAARPAPALPVRGDVHIRYLREGDGTDLRVGGVGLALAAAA
jgi:hypothetical protein